MRIILPLSKRFLPRHTPQNQHPGLSPDNRRKPPLMSVRDPNYAPFSFCHISDKFILYHARDYFAPRSISAYQKPSGASDRKRTLKSFPKSA